MDLTPFRDAGFQVFPCLARHPEALAWGREVDRLLARPANRDATNLRTGLSWRPGAASPERLDPVIDISDAFAALARDPRVLAIASEALGGAPTLLKDKLVLKAPGMDGYAPHQDAGWWQGFAFERIVTLAIAIDPATRANGGLALWSGYQKELLSRRGELRDLSASEQRALDPARRVAIDLAPGDAVLFHALAPHESAKNESALPRRMLFLTYGLEKDGTTYEAFQAWYVALSLAHLPAGERAKHALR